MTNNISEKIKCITEVMAEEMEAYEEYMEYAERFKDTPAIYDLFTHIAKEEQHHFNELYTLLQDYMNDLRVEMEGKVKSVATHPQNGMTHHPISHNRRS